MTLYDTIRIVRTVRTVRIVTQYIEISLNLVRIYEKRSTRRSFMRTVHIITICLPIPSEDTLPGFTLRISLVDDCISQVRYYSLFSCYNFHHLHIHGLINYRKILKRQVKMNHQSLVTNVTILLTVVMNSQSTTKKCMYARTSVVEFRNSYG